MMARRRYLNPEREEARSANDRETQRRPFNREEEQSQGGT